jgi:hypothetical protein
MGEFRKDQRECSFGEAIGSILSAQTANVLGEFGK